MPVVDTISRGTPRSALRYRPPSKTNPDEQQVPLRRASLMRTQQSRAVRTAAARPVVNDKDDLDEDAPDTRIHSVQGRQSKPSGQKTERGHRRVDTLIMLNVGALIMLVLWVLGLQIFSWGTSALNTLRYGYPRTFQMDVVVGHQDSPASPSHFMAINLHGRVEVIEWPGGDASHSRIYLGPQLLGPGADQQPVTLRFADVNSDHLPDMIVEMQGAQIAWVNTGDSFRPLKPGEHYSLG